MKKSTPDPRKPPEEDPGAVAAVDIEALILGALLIDSERNLPIVRELSVNDFYTERHRRIFLRALELDQRGERIDRVTITNELKKRGQLESVGGATYLTSLDQGLPDIVNLDSYIRIIKDKSTRRRVIDFTEALGKNAWLPTQETDSVIAAGAQFFQELQTASNHKGASSWPEPLPIGSELPEVDSFDPLLLPEALRAFVEDIAERMQVPPDYPAACLMVAMAGAVNRRATIQPKAQDSSWKVVPNLWGGIIAPPGFLKSPVLHAITAPLYAQEAIWRAEYKSAKADYEAEQEEAKLRVSAWKQQTTAAFKRGGQPLDRPGASSLPPVAERLITSDSTFEKLHVLMEQNPAGLLVIRDELTGWWAELDREGRQGERGFFLSAWNGDTPFTIDRIGRETVHVEACCISMIGGITPGRLRSYLVDALQDGPSNDGLPQRFQVLVWPDPPRDWRYVDRQPQNHQVIYRMFERILLWGSPLVFRFDAQAQEFFVDWLGRLERKIRNEELHPALVAHLSKYRKLMPALALLLSAAEQLTFAGGLHDPPLVFRENAEQAAGLCTYLESHARRIYACVVTPAMQAAADLTAKIKAKEVEVDGDGTFYVRDVYRHGWSRLDTPERALAALDILETSGWVRRVQNDPMPGRPPNRYTVNPRVHHGEYS